LSVSTEGRLRAMNSQTRNTNSPASSASTASTRNHQRWRTRPNSPLKPPISRLMRIFMLEVVEPSDMRLAV
jgi:hypothetical protein